MRTVVYIDGFNLYYRALRNTPFRWLDVAKLCRLLLPRHQVHRIHYYTARIVPRPENPQQAVRQDVYLRALRTIPELDITYGQFVLSRRRYPLARDPSQIVEVLRVDEKGTDVNLAAHLVFEAMRGEFEAAVIVSNDSDLAEPIRIVAKILRKTVGILPPAKFPSRELLAYATFYKPIRRAALEASQFPAVIYDIHGTIRKPEGW